MGDPSRAVPETPAAEPGPASGVTEQAAARPSDAELVLAAELLLRSNPWASVAAAADNGLFVPMPAIVPLTSHVVVDGPTSALDLVEPDDVMAVVEAWKVARRTGSAQAEVRARNDPSSVHVLHFIDLRKPWGVVLMAAVHPHGLGKGFTGRGAGGVPLPRVSVVRKNDLAEFVDVDAAATAMLGYSRDELIGLENLSIIHPEDHPRAITNWMEVMAGASRRVRLRQQHRDGRWIWFEFTNQNLLSDPVEQCVLTEMIDISEEMSVLETLRANEHLLRRLTESLPVGVLQIDADRAVVHSNARLTALLGNMADASFDEVFAGVAPSDSRALQDAVDAAFERGEDADLEISASRDDGALIRCRLNFRPLSDEDGHPTGALVCVEDVTDRARLVEELEQRASFDALTGCHNRSSILDALERALTDATASGTGVVVAFVDLDGFKAVNDRRGHAEGDRLLQRVGRSLGGIIRREDSVGRYGGDEFLVLGRSVDAVEEAHAFGERLSAHLRQDLTPEPPHLAAASIGVAWFDGADRRDGVDADGLIRRADVAMYASKRQGLGHAVVFAPGQDALA